jgi:diguanylate cyclase (GGDEF)-like protein
MQNKNAGVVMNIIDKASINRLFHNITNKSAKERIIKDRTTGLPTLISTFALLEDRIESAPIGLIYIDIKDFKNIEDIYGGDICNKILKSIADILKHMEVHLCGPREKIAVCSLGGDDFIVFVEATDSITVNDYETEYLNLKKKIEDSINRTNLLTFIYKPLSVHLGYTEIQLKANTHIEKLIYKAIKEAEYAAKQFEDAREHANLRKIRQIIDQKQIRTVYQPIYSLRTGCLLGYEALSRGPEGSNFEYPTDLFAVADNFQCLQELENLCHTTAIMNIGANCEDVLLFLNINPLVLNRNNYETGLIHNLIQDSHLKNLNVVLELTERTQIFDYAELRDNLSYYRQQGFMIAIDDTGSGYSSLAAIAELQPEFVKIDMSLVRDVNKSPVKKAMLETLTGFCSKINARIICEGIETEEELKALCGIGCDYGQGFLLGQPGEMNRTINPLALKHIKPELPFKFTAAHTITSQIGEIAVISEPISPLFSVDQVIKLLKENKLVNGLVVCEDLVPTGLIMRDKFFAILSNRYGFDLFIKRPITEIMDRNMLVLPWNTPLEEAAQLVAERLGRGVNDYLVITQDNKYYGIVSSAKLLDTMADINIRIAQDASPLTGLPGNKCISSRLIKDLEEQCPIMVLYFDLDNFKAFNDYYGFEHGDRVIVLLANLIRQAVEAYGNKDDLIGHIGGDDFIVITSPAQADDIANEVIHLFYYRINEFYDKSDLKNGYIISASRQGQKSHIPIMSLSIAGINTENKLFTNHLEISEAAAEVKKKAKAIAGNTYLVDRRCQEA